MVTAIVTTSRLYFYYFYFLFFVYVVRFGAGDLSDLPNTAHRTNTAQTAQYRTQWYAVLDMPMACGTGTFDYFRQSRVFL